MLVLWIDGLGDKADLRHRLAVSMMTSSCRQRLENGLSLPRRSSSITFADWLDLSTFLREHVEYPDPAALAAAHIDPEERRFVELMASEVNNATPSVVGAAS